MSSTEKTEENLSKLDFLIIGSAKAGSNSIHRYIASHPDVFMPKDVGVWEEIGLFLKPSDQSIKELTNNELRQNKSDDEILADIFENYSGEAVSGIRSTDYSKTPFRSVNFRSIIQHNPAIKFIFAIRDPLEKLLSQYRHFRRNRAEFTDANFVKEVEGYDYYQHASAYAYQAEQYFSHFDENQLMFVVTEQMKEDPQHTINEVFGFLGVNKFEIPATVIGKKYNVDVSAHKSQLSIVDIPQNIQNFIRKDTQRLQKMVNVELSKYWNIG